MNTVYFVIKKIELNVQRNTLISTDSFFMIVILDKEKERKMNKN